MGIYLDSKDKSVMLAIKPASLSLSPQKMETLMQ